ncbi:MAG: 2OG-Fe(II) oxygenase [Cyclobacteriaceae bacterium]|nr:2OG-Fe(II) oxygenase [Cyclobacteriaceae bacterium]
MKPIPDLNWPDLYHLLNHSGIARIPDFLTREECDELIRSYSEASHFRSTISMERYRFGKGEYKYYSYPLLPRIARMRTDFFTPLAKLANEWMNVLEIPVSYPEDHAVFIAQCHAAGQLRPTPLILKYEAGGYNTLHQDLYGEIYFPFQVVILLTEPGRDHEGGELVFVEQLPRAQSKATVIAPRQGDAVIFTTNFRPVKGTRGWYRSKMKHGVSTVTAGKRHACGIIFHDAA